jgi:hypothetical protein
MQRSKEQTTQWLFGTLIYSWEKWHNQENPKKEKSMPP